MIVGKWKSAWENQIFRAFIDDPSPPTLSFLLLGSQLCVPYCCFILTFMTLHSLSFFQSLPFSLLFLVEGNSPAAFSFVWLDPIPVSTEDTFEGLLITTVSKCKLLPLVSKPFSTTKKEISWSVEMVFGAFCHL